MKYNTGLTLISHLLVAHPGDESAGIDESIKSGLCRLGDVVEQALRSPSGQHHLDVNDRGGGESRNDLAVVALLELALATFDGDEVAGSS